MRSYLVITDGIAHIEGIVLQAILGINTLLVFLIFYLVLFSLLNHALDFILAQATFVICNDNLVLAPCKRPSLFDLVTCCIASMCRL